MRLGMQGDAHWQRKGIPEGSVRAKGAIAHWYTGTHVPMAALPEDLLSVIAPHMSLGTFRSARQTCRMWKAFLPWRMEGVDHKGNTVWTSWLTVSRIMVPRMHELDRQHIRLMLLGRASDEFEAVRVDLFFAHRITHLALHSALLDVCDVDDGRVLHRAYLDLESPPPFDVRIFPLGSLDTLFSSLKQVERREVVKTLRRHF